ncbi:MAG: cyclic nucleotide-binding domain-containing protein [Verrucomicrobia bacterium]|nr:cyclic nucleotide-binding domain-containing protein [Verrucomicrobiota bacterium]
MKLPDILWKPEFCLQFQAGQTILKEGEVGNTLMVLLEGQIEVQVRGKMVGTFEPIEIFGEMAVIDSQPRSATVIAKKNSRLARIDQTRFKALIQNKPDFAIDVMRGLVERMRWMDSIAAKRQAEEQALAIVPPDGAQKEFEELKKSLESVAGQIDQILRKFKST